MKHVVEIHWRIIVETNGAILDQGLRVRKPILEGDPINERLQGRTRRARRTGHVDCAEPLVIEISSRSDMGHHFAGAIIDDQSGDRDLFAKGFGIPPGYRFRSLLQVPID